MIVDFLVMCLSGVFGRMETLVGVLYGSVPPREGGRLPYERDGDARCFALGLN